MSPSENVAPAPGEDAREAERIAVLEALDVLDSEAEPAPDHAARAAAFAFGAPIAFVSLVDRNRQWFKSCYGSDIRETPRSVSFCSHAIQSPDDVMVVGDARKDERFQNNPLVTGDLQVRYYAGAPIIVHGHAVGSLCVIDHEPRAETPEGLVLMLKELAGLVSISLESRLLQERAERAEADYRLANARMSVALDAASMTIWTWDLLTNRLVNYGRGRDEDEQVEFTLDAFVKSVVPEDGDGIMLAASEARLGHAEYRAEYRMLADPDTWMMSAGKAIAHNTDGTIAAITGIEADVTGQKRHDMLLQTTAMEMRHRVNNLIGLADALAGRTARETGTMEEFLELYRSRLQALARTQKMLMASEGRARLTDLVEAVIAPFRRKDRSVIRMDLPELQVRNAMTQVLTLIFHELTTNALKYGALRWPNGKVMVAGEVKDERLRITWTEIMDAEGGEQPFDDYVEISSSQRGTSIVDRMVKAQGGTIDFDFREQGLVVRVDLPQD